MLGLVDPYRRAAAAYAAYGLVYLTGAVMQLTPDRQRDFFGFVPWWVFYLAGLLVVCTLPVLVWRRYRWLTRVLSVFPAIKAFTLLIKQGRLMGIGEPTVIFNWFFAAVALVAAVLLFRAGWGAQDQARVGTSSVGVDQNS